MSDRKKNRESQNRTRAVRIMVRIRAAQIMAHTRTDLIMVPIKMDLTTVRTTGSIKMAHTMVRITDTRMVRTMVLETVRITMDSTSRMDLITDNIRMDLIRTDLTMGLVMVRQRAENRKTAMQPLPVDIREERIRSHPREKPEEESFL